MKILHVESGMHLYGGALQVVFLIRALRNLGHECVLACPENSDIAEAARPYAMVHTLRMSGDLDLGMVPRLRALIKREQPDVVHLHSRRGADIWGGVAARSASCPVVLSRRVDNPEPAWLAKLKYRLYDRVVTISEGIFRVLASEGVPRDKLRCVRSAVDTDQYRPAKGDGLARQLLLSEFAVRPDQLAVGMVAQFIPRKGHRTLLNALPTVIAACPQIKVLLFGQGPIADEIRKSIADSPVLSQHVVMAGFRRDLDQILPGLDLLVHPAYMEGLGVSLLQAAACGVPLIGGRAGGIPEIVHPGVNGELIEPGDAVGLAAAMVDVLSSSERRRAYSEAGRELVLARFSIDAMVRGNLAVYQELLV